MLYHTQPVKGLCGSALFTPTGTHLGNVPLTRAPLMQERKQLVAELTYQNSAVPAHTGLKASLSEGPNLTSASVNNQKILPVRVFALKGILSVQHDFNNFLIA